MSSRKFKVGDIVKSSHGIGFVGWTKNECMNIKEEDGLLGISLQTDGCGFVSPVKEGDCEKSSLKEIIFFYKEQTRDAGIRCQEYANKSKNYDALLNENKLLKELLSGYFEQRGKLNDVK